MKRFLVVSVKEGEDSKTKEKLLFVSMYRMPSKMKNGGLWYRMNSFAAYSAHQI